MLVLPQWPIADLWLCTRVGCLLQPLGCVWAFFLPRRNIKHHTFLQQLNSTQLNSVLVRHSSARLTRRGPPSHWAGRLPPKVKFMSWACEFQPWSAPPRPADDSQVVGGIQTFSLVLCFFLAFLKVVFLFAFSSLGLFFSFHS